nr:hypothetical conserved protein [uncultured Gammaproteobacteria bacterium]
MRFLAEFILRSRMQAIAVAATCLMLSLLAPPVSLLAAAVVALVTLRQGWREGLNTVLASALAAGLLGAIVIGNFALPAGYGLMLWLPIWAIALALRYTRSLGWTFELVTALGLVGVAAAYLLGADVAGFWQTRMQQALRFLSGQIDFDQAQLAALARYMTGIAAAGMVSSLALSLLLARYLQALLFNPGGFRAEFLGLRLHRPMAYLALALSGAAMVLEAQAREAVVNLLLVLGVVYVVAGTAILHAIFVERGHKGWLFGLYGLLLVVPHALLPIALVGLSDAWLDWRGRFVPRDSGSD